MISKTASKSESRARALPADVAETEAYRVLVSHAEGKTGALPAEGLARLVMENTDGADWPVRREAMEAALRRLAAARREELRVADRAARGEPYGIYATNRRGEKRRPYTTRLLGLEPLRGSCDCRDFMRNSLGLCKHLAAVVEDLAAHPRRWRRALREDGHVPHTPELEWDPVRPLDGSGDWLERALLRPGRTRPRSAAWSRVYKRFRGGELKQAHVENPRLRLQLVRDLLAVKAGDPALRALLRREMRNLARPNASREAARAVGRSLRTLKRELYPYQREGVKRFLEQGGLLLGDDMGLGKTAQAIAACHVLWSKRAVRRGLLIVPASLKPQWLREWHLFSDTPVAVVDGNPAQREEIYRRTRAGFLVVNYEQVLRDLEQMHAWKPGLVILDEAQRIKNWATKTAAYVKKLSPPYRLVLTGTPMENRLDELASLMEWVDDMALEPKWRLVPWHTMYADGTREVVGARNLETLRQRLKDRMLRRTRPEVLGQLPKRTDTVVPVEMTEAQNEEHHALKRPICRLMRIAQRRPLTRGEFLKLMQLLTTQRIICNGLAQLHFQEIWPGLGAPAHARLKSLDSPKLLELREIVSQLLEQERKIVVFSQWRRMLSLAHWAVGDVLEEHGRRAAFFTGKESARRRTRNIVDFHDDPATAVLFSTDAGGVGLNLQRAATCCVNLELPWNPAVLEQRIARIHRIGQTQPIDVYNLVAQEGIEGRIARLVCDKRALFTGLFDGTSDEIRFEGSGAFLSRLEELVGPEDVPELSTDDEDAEERALEEVLGAADEAGDTEGAPRKTPRAAPQELLSRLRIETTDSGGLRIEAPAEAAAALAALFEGMASLLRNQAGSESETRLSG